MKNIFPSLIGNERIRQTLSAGLSHAYIIEGNPGSGRLTSARLAAAAALCENRDADGGDLPCGKCSACSRIFRGIHPDVSEFSTGSKKSIGVETAREIRSQVFISPSESEYKFFIIRDADLMTPEAQNALLISIEEPPAFSVFFLLASDKSMLLETIRSRCVTLSTERLSDDIIAERLRGIPEGERMHSADPSAFEKIVKNADGSIGEAIRLITGDFAASDEIRDAAAELICVILTGTPAEKVQLAVSFPKTRDTQDRIFTLATAAVRDIISLKYRTEAPLLFYGNTSEAAVFSAVSPIKLMKLHASLEDGRGALTGNASPSLTAEKIIMQKL